MHHTMHVLDAPAPGLSSSKTLLKGKAKSIPEHCVM